MHRIVQSLFFLLLCAPALFAGEDQSKTSASTTQTDALEPPQLLGVWYGTYPTQTDDGKKTAQLWMEVSWQLSKQGWSIAGFNRWNVLGEPTDPLQTKPGQEKESPGKAAEHFDTFRGRIDRDLTHVEITEDQRGSVIDAVLTGSDTLRATFTESGATTPSFEVTLKRIDTGYDPADSRIQGIDVSHHSGAVDWQKVRAQNYHFAYVKSSEGVDNPDARFEEHWNGLKATDMERGAYHFYVTEDDPVEQAKFFASRLKDDPGTLPPAVDVELLGKGTTGDMTTTLLTFLRTLEDELGIKPMIYTGPKFWDEYYRPEFSDYHLWMAEYGVHMPKVPFGWDRWLFWQRAADQTIDGVEKNADVSIIHPHVSLDTIAGKP